jgi:hypothetical protein
MMRYQGNVAAVAEAYRNARELMGNEATAFELARQCYNDLWPGQPTDHVDRKVEQIVRPVRNALAAGRSCCSAGRVSAVMYETQAG